MIKISKQKKRNKPIYLKGRLYFTYAIVAAKETGFFVSPEIEAAKLRSSLSTSPALKKWNVTHSNIIFIDMPPLLFNKVFS